MKKRFLLAGLPAIIAVLALWVGMQLAPQPASASPSKATFPNVASTTVTRVGTKLRIAEQTRVVVTEAGTITPVGSNQPISSTGAVGTSSIAAGTEGDLLYLVNVGAQTITLTDTGTLKLAGNFAMGVTDGITLMFDGTNWVEVTRANN